MSFTETVDDCSICLSALSPGSLPLTLSCNHKFHLECLALVLKAKNMECPLCRVPIDTKLVQMLDRINNNSAQAQPTNSVRQHHRQPSPTNDVNNRKKKDSINNLCYRLFLQWRIRSMRTLCEYVPDVLQNDMLPSLR
jgi:hypothetical protein